MPLLFRRSLALISGLAVLSNSLLPAFVRADELLSTSSGAVTWSGSDVLVVQPLAGSGNFLVIQGESTNSGSVSGEKMTISLVSSGAVMGTSVAEIVQPLTSSGVAVGVVNNLLAVSGSENGMQGSGSSLAEAQSGNANMSPMVSVGNSGATNSGYLSVSGSSISSAGSSSGTMVSGSGTEKKNRENTSSGVLNSESGSSRDTTETDEEEEDILDLGNDDAEKDALKDFAGVVRQSKPYTCGPASLATLRTQLGDDTSEADVLEYITNMNEGSGTSLLALKNASLKLRSQTILKAWTADQVLAYVKETQDPVLIHDQKKGVGGHFSVIREYDAQNGKVELSDTEAGNIKYSVEDFHHIYDGYALVIYDDEKIGMLADATTDLSDEVAGTVWGKYVPVYMIAEGSENVKARQDAQNFKDCVAKAMRISDKNKRNLERSGCYVRLGENLIADLTNPQAYMINSIYDESQDFKNSWGIGSDDILTSLNSILSNQEKTISLSTDRRQLLPKTQGYDTSRTIFLQWEISTISTKIQTTKQDISALSWAIAAKVSIITALDREISAGTFSQNGQTFSLGAVGNQISAQADTVKRLSSGLAKKLSDLDGQISNKNNQINNLARQRISLNNDLVSAQNQASSWYSQILTKQRQRRSYSYEQNQYNYYNSRVGSIQSQINGIQSQINTLYRDIDALKNQKTQASNEVNNASAEKARLDRLKTFGDQEVQRKKNALSTLRGEVVNLQTQKDKKTETLNTSQSQYDQKKSVYDALVSLQKIDVSLKDLEGKILAEARKYGFTTITTTNTDETKRLIAEEKDFYTIKDSKLADALDEKVTKTAVKYVQDHPFQAIGAGAAWVVVVGGAIACSSVTLGACAAAVGMSVPGLVALFGTTTAVGAYQTVNGVKVVLTQSDLFGNAVSDDEWSEAIFSTTLNAALIAAGARFSSLGIPKSTTTSSASIRAGLTTLRSIEVAAREALTSEQVQNVKATLAKSNSPQLLSEAAKKLSQDGVLTRAADIESRGLSASDKAWVEKSAAEWETAMKNGTIKKGVGGGGGSAVPVSRIINGVKYDLKVLKAKVTVKSTKLWYEFVAERDFVKMMDEVVNQSSPRDVYRNVEEFIPRKPSGYYQEWTIRTPEYPSVVGPERIITGLGWELYYVRDHYQTSFTPLNDISVVIK